VTTDRKAAIAAYKERKTFAGVFVIRCKASSQAWVGQTPNLEKIQNRIWFTLRQGSHTCRTLQGHGPRMGRTAGRSRNANGWKRKKRPTSAMR
jgi:hypothetical protein